MSELKCRPNCNLNLSRESGPDSLAAAGSSSEPAWLNGGSAVLDPQGRILSLNNALAFWLSSSPSGLIGQSLPGLLGKRSTDWEETLRRFLEGSASFDRLELSTAERPAVKLNVEVCRHNGASFLRLESALPPIAETEGLFPEACWGGVISRAAFQRMLRSETQLDNLMNRWPGIIFSQRPDFSFVFVSPKIEDLTGVPASEWRRQSHYFWEVVHEADAEALTARLRSEAHSPAGMTSTFRIRHVRTGRVTYLWEHRRTVRSSNGLMLGFEGIWLDITRQTIAERRLLNMSWRENLGTLTLGLAHDFCNIMTGIVGLSETFEANLDVDSSVRGGLSLIRTTALQASELAHRIRQLHQGLPGEKNYLDLNEALSSLVEVLQKVLPRRVRVKSALAPGQLPLYVDAVELQQVIVNLALNAADAMPKSGELTFRTARLEQMPETHNLVGLAPHAPVVCLSVQ